MRFLSDEGLQLIKDDAAKQAVIKERERMGKVIANLTLHYNEDGIPFVHWQQLALIVEPALNDAQP